MTKTTLGKGPLARVLTLSSTLALKSATMEGNDEEDEKKKLEERARQEEQEPLLISRRSRSRC